MEWRIQEVKDDFEWNQAVKPLMVEYVRSLNVDLSFQSVELELESAHIPRPYSTQMGGSLLICYCLDVAVGCVCLRSFKDTTQRSSCVCRGNVCEMKRLYVRNSHRGKGIGEALVHGIINVAKTCGLYDYMVLDTLASMGSARRLYEGLGFYEIDAYYNNPLAAIYYGATLKECSVVCAAGGWGKSPLIRGFSDGTISFGERRRILCFPQEEPVRRICGSEDEESIVVGGRFGSVGLVDGRHNWRVSLGSHATNSIEAVCFAPTGMVSSGYDATLCLWQVEKEKPRLLSLVRRVLCDRGPEMWLGRLGETIVSGGWGRAVSYWAGKSLDHHGRGAMYDTLLCCGGQPWRNGLLLGALDGTILHYIQGRLDLEVILKLDWPFDCMAAVRGDRLCVSGDRGVAMVHLISRTILFEKICKNIVGCCFSGDDHDEILCATTSGHLQRIIMSKL